MTDISSWLEIADTKTGEIGDFKYINSSPRSRELPAYSTLVDIRKLAGVRRAQNLQIAERIAAQISGFLGLLQQPLTFSEYISRGAE